MSDTLHQTEGGSAAQTLPPQPTQDDALPLDLREHVHRLRLILESIASRTWRRRQQEAHT